MRRLAPVAAFALFLAVPLWAQHGGGGHGGGGGHAGGFGGGHASSGFSGGHVSGFSGSHSGGFASHPGRSFTPSASAHGFSSHGPYLHDHNNGVHFHTTFGFHNNCWGYACRGYGYGYYPWGWGYYDPSWWWDGNSSSYDDDYNQDLATAAEMNRQNLEEQRMLRQEQADGDQDAYADRYDGPRRSYQADGNAQLAQAPEKKGSPMFGDTVLVFRDKHQEEVENYAIVGDVLWNFAPGHTRKISLDDLDLAATEKANEDRGTTFRLPSGS
jgi:hypothetical protein